MNNATSQKPATGGSSRRIPGMWVVLICLFLVVIAALLFTPKNAINGGTKTDDPRASAEDRSGAAFRVSRPIERGATGGPARSPEEIVAEKVNQFAKNRREIVRTIARRSKKTVPPEVEKFFDTLEAGRWDDIKAGWDGLAKRSGQYERSTHSPELDPYWPAILDAYGVAEQAHLWPSQKLLDYGNAILDSLRPGMVYVGGTDNGRWIPELLNETGDDERHIIITQNAFADSRYLDYVNELYGGKLATLTGDDSQRAFQEYLSDAQKRLSHDQQYPDEPKQVRPGEDIRVEDGKVQVSGRVAVMAINEKMLQMLMDKNPERAFALEESTPLKGTYTGAAPLGPIMELRADGEAAFTPERATQTLSYWQDKTQQLLADPEAIGSDSVLKAYSHDVVGAANLLASHEHAAEAEQAYRLSIQLWPESAESVRALADLLARQGRAQESGQLLEDYRRKYPKQAKELDSK